MRAALAGSGVLHLVAVLLALFGLPWPSPAPPPTEWIVPVNLVRLGERTVSPSAPAMASLPQDRAPEATPLHQREAVPVEQTPSPPVPHEAKKPALPDPPAGAKPERMAESPLAAKLLKPASAETRAAERPSPADDLAARLKRLAQLRQPAPPIPPAPQPQDGTGWSNVTAASAIGAHGRDASYGVKDFIRAQVQRRWNLGRPAARAEHWTVSIHITLDPEGGVSGAEIVGDPRYATNEAYLDFARSARNAVLLSSPLKLPPDAYDIARDIVVEFNSTQVSQ